MSAQNDVLDGRALEIVCNVNKYFEDEKKLALALLNKMTDGLTLGSGKNITMARDVYAKILETLQNAGKVAERVRLATGLNKNTITRIRRECRTAEANNSNIVTPKKKPRGKSIVCDNLEISALHNIINSLHTNKKETPSLNKIFAIAKEDLKFRGCKTTLRRIIIESLGFKFKKRQNTRVPLIQRSNSESWHDHLFDHIHQEDCLEGNKSAIALNDSDEDIEMSGTKELRNTYL